MKAALIVLALALAACSHKPAADLAGNAESDFGGYMVGTLASVDSFEFKTAPIYTRLAVIRHQAATSLRHHEITVEQAQSIQDQADQVRTLVDTATSLCAQNQKTGQCTKSEGDAQNTLDQAAAALAAIQ